jgi:Holliday junction resolvase RusA-like endonuclease
MKVAGTARFQRAGKVHMVPKRGNTEWATLVGAIGRQHAPKVLLQGPVMLTAHFYMPRPGSAKKAQWPLKRPDLDNLIHKLTDQFNGVFWKDDSQIVELRVGKRFAEDGKIGLEIVVHDLS